jgi:hypothetical protein
VLAPVGLLAGPALAHGAVPRSAAILEAHRHNTGGHDWHVQLELNRKSDRLATVVVFSQKCKQTGYTAGFALTKDHRFSITRKLPDNQGTWELEGSFPDPDHAVGTWKVTTDTCQDTGPYRAQDATGHFLIGNPYEYAPPRITGDSRAAAFLQRLKYDSRANRHRYDTIGKARAQGYVLSTATGCPGMHHARKHGTQYWGKMLDPAAPQSLVYWCDSQRHWTLAAFMFRAPAEKRPPTFGTMIQWHKHGPTADWMMHLWLVPDIVSAYASCAPFPAMKKYGMLSYETYRIDAHIDTPCSDSYPAEAR